MKALRELSDSYPNLIHKIVQDLEKDVLVFDSWHFQSLRNRRVRKLQRLRNK